MHVLSKRSIATFSAGFMLLAMFTAGTADAAKSGGKDALWQTTVAYHGYVKVDAMHSRYSAGDPGPQSIGRDFYIAAAVPVGPTDRFSGTDFHAKQSRFRFDTSTSYFDDEPIRGRFELDFMNSPGGDERVSNSYNPRVRHAFFTFKNLLAGQTWTNFMDVATFPDTLNFTGSSDSVVFVRQPQFRITLGNLQLAAENPETVVTPNGGGGRIVAGDSRLPDLTASYSLKFNQARLSFGAIARDLILDDGNDIDDQVWGYGFNVTGKFPLGRHELRFLAAAGEGIGRYVGLNTVNDVSVTASNRLELLPLASAYLNYRHKWNATLRSNLVLSMLEVDNDTELTGTGVTRRVRSIIGNLIWDWRPEVSFGVEFLHAERTVESGEDGDLDRLQFSAKYSF